MVLDVKPGAKVGPIIIYSKQDMLQLHDECKTALENYLITLDILFPHFFLNPRPGSK